MMEKTWEPAVRWIGEEGALYRQKNVQLPPRPCLKCKSENGCQKCSRYRLWVGGCLRIIRRLFLLPVEKEPDPCINCRSLDVCRSFDRTCSERKRWEDEQ